MKDIEKRYGGDIEEILRGLYVDKNMNLYDMANELGISHVTLIKWLKLAGVRSRKLRVDG